MLYSNQHAICVTICNSLFSRTAPLVVEYGLGTTYGPFDDNAHTTINEDNEDH